jgi:DNA repair protein RecO (recombination protein O)
VVLSRRRSGEQDLLVTFLTPELGLLSAIAKNATRSVKRFGGGLLDPGTSAFYEFRIRGDSDFGLVAKAERAPGAYAVIPRVPVMQALAAWALELVRAFETPRSPARESFFLLKAHLAALSLESGAPPALAARSLSLGFSARYLETAGFGATIRACSGCGKPPATGEWAWDAVNPRAFCPECLALADGSVLAGLSPVPSGTLAAINSLLPDVPPPLPLPREEAALAEAYFCTLASSVSGKGFLSRMSMDRYLEEPARESREQDREGLRAEAGGGGGGPEAPGVRRHGPAQSPPPPGGVREDPAGSPAPPREPEAPPVRPEAAGPPAESGALAEALALREAERWAEADALADEDACGGAWRAEGEEAPGGSGPGAGTGTLRGSAPGSPASGDGAPGARSARSGAPPLADPYAPPAAGIGDGPGGGSGTGAPVFPDRPEDGGDGGEQG